jgi:hypothetical protein
MRTGHAVALLLVLTSGEGLAHQERDRSPRRTATTSQGQKRSTSTTRATGPLRVHPRNPRYFTDRSGRAIYLTGSHTWDNLQDSGTIGKPLTRFDYNAYLDLLQSHDHNFMRMWAWEGGVNKNYYEPLCYRRTGAGTALDGKPKFDLKRFNEAYFKRLRDRVAAARRRGIYVSVMLFQGRFIKTYEATNPKQHPIGMTAFDSGREGSMAALWASPADWISPQDDGTAGDFRGDPPAADGRKVMISDTDHLWGEGGDHHWVWKSFLRGYNPIYMDRVAAITKNSEGDITGAESARRAMGNSRRLAERVDLAAMRPHHELASTRYCLADPGSAYLIYLPDGGEVTVDLGAASGMLAVEWINPRTDVATDAGRVQGGHSAPLTRRTRATGSCICGENNPHKLRGEPENTERH